MLEWWGKVDVLVVKKEGIKDISVLWTNNLIQTKDQIIEFDDHHQCFINLKIDLYLIKIQKLSIKIIFKIIFKEREKEDLILAIQQGVHLVYKIIKNKKLIHLLLKMNILYNKK